MTVQSHKERVRTTLRHQTPDRVPLDFGSTNVTGMHASCIAGLRQHYGLENRPIKILELGQMLGVLDEDLKQAMGVDIEGVFRKTTRYGFPAQDWKVWQMPDGLEVLVPGSFNTTVDEKGDILIYPKGDLTAPPSGRMPAGGFFFDNIIRQETLNEEVLNPEDNLEEFTPITDEEVHHLEAESLRAAHTGRAVIASFGGTSFGDISLVPGPSLKHPRGIRDVAEWYMSTRLRQDYIHRVFAGQCKVALKNLEKIAARTGDRVDAIMVCGADFGSQAAPLCSVPTFRQLWMPYYQEINRWIHANMRWKTFKHSCGAVEKFLDAFIESGFDIINPVQCSAAGMDPERLKKTYGERLVFWGGGVDTQQVLPFGSAQQVREQVLKRCEVFSSQGGFVFNSIHNVQAGTPVENIVAMIDAVHEFNGERP